MYTTKYTKYPLFMINKAAPVTKGTKYIMRTEIMFTRVDSEVIPHRYKYKEDTKYLTALSLYRKSYEFEMMGDTKKFVHGKWILMSKLHCNLFASYRTSKTGSKYCIK